MVGETIPMEGLGKPLTPEGVARIWRDPKTRPAFAKSLISSNFGDGRCYCAQGHVLHLAGWSDGKIMETYQDHADRDVATILGISTAHSILLRHVNDADNGCPEDVLDASHKVLGDQAPRILAFWRHLDRMRSGAWEKAYRASKTPSRRSAKIASDAATAAYGRKITHRAGDAVRTMVGHVRATMRFPSSDLSNNAWHATSEILGADHLRSGGIPFVFLPLFGIKTPSDLDNEVTS